MAVLRTFSKAYGLAGLRVGYAVAHEPLAEALRKAAIPFGVNSLAQVAAVASLEAFDELEVRVKELVAERARVVDALVAQGWVLPDAQANFVWFALGELTGEFAAACEAAGLTVRPYGSDGARATIGEREANDRLIEVAGEFYAAHWAPSRDLRSTSGKIDHWHEAAPGRRPGHVTGRSRPDASSRGPLSRRGRTRPRPAAPAPRS